MVSEKNYLTQIIHATLALMREGGLISQKSFCDVVSFLNECINKHKEELKNTVPSRTFEQKPTTIKVTGWNKNE